AGSPEGGETAPAGGRTAQEQAVMIKYGLLAGCAVVAVVVIIVLFKVLFSGSSAKPAQAAQAPAAVVQAEVAQTVTLTAVDATRVKIVQELDGAVLFNGSLARGETKTL